MNKTANSPDHFRAVELGRQKKKTTSHTNTTRTRNVSFVICMSFT